MGKKKDIQVQKTPIVQSEAELLRAASPTTENIQQQQQQQQQQHSQDMNSNVGSGAVFIDITSATVPQLKAIINSKQQISSMGGIERGLFKIMICLLMLVFMVAVIALQMVFK